MVLRLQSLPPAAADRQDVLVRTIELLVEDVRDEEDLLLPRLQTALTPTQLKLLGLAWEVVRRIAPTRPHPIVSRRPPGNMLSALPLSLLDRSRDRLDSASYRSSNISHAARLRRIRSHYPDCEEMRKANDHRDLVGGDPYGNRTRVSAVKGPRPNR